MLGVCQTMLGCSGKGRSSVKALFKTSQRHVYDVATIQSGLIFRLLTLAIRSDDGRQTEVLLLGWFPLLSIGELSDTY